MDLRELLDRDRDTIFGGRQSITIDEIQRDPELLLRVKAQVDADRRAGRFLLTGSANLLLMNRVSESLAGRASYLTLWPMSRREQLGLGSAGSWEQLLASKDSDWLEILDAEDAIEGDWRSLCRKGGFPTPALELRDKNERGVWFEGYVRTYLERDLQALSSISSLSDYRRLMRSCAHRLGQMLNQSELARELSLPQPTVHRWLNLLETSYLLVRLPALTRNRRKRLVKTPKLYWGDVGTALHLAGNPEPTGAHFENLVLGDLLVWRDSRTEQAELCYWRTSTGEEVDFVIESEGRLLPIEIKSKGRPRPNDAKGLLAFRREYPEASRCGLLIHGGKTLEWILPEVLAVPWTMLL